MAPASDSAGTGEDLPSGTVTFLFSDIEGSTRHWEREPDRMRESLALHDRILRGAVESHGGRVVKTTGDGVHAVFTDAQDGVAAAVAAQTELGRVAWPTDPLLVRIGLHTGTAERRANDYFGPVLNRAARVMAAGHGGQILCSQATSDLVRDAILPDVGLLDLGEHRLQDLGRAERIYQVTHPDLGAAFAPLRSLDRYRTNLAVQPSVFVGRVEELKRVDEALKESSIVTLTGVGGVGKTRLALQVGADVVTRFPDGVWIVELSTVAEATAVDETVAVALDLTSAPGRSFRAGILDYLRDRELLLVLDNCEHVVAAVAELVEAVTLACPLVRVLATSREGLAVDGERLLAVPPLGLPHDGTVEQVGASDAGRLFVERAQAVNETFQLDAANAPVLANLARRLDGIPLALELAAARMRSMAPADILEHLDERFRLLTGGRRTALSRQQTLRGAIDWSYELLDEPSRALLCRLGCFVGGFDLEMVEAVCIGPPVEGFDVPDLVQGLIERSLIVADTTRVPARYLLLETIRDYALDRLDERGEREELSRRHADYFVDLARELGAGIRGPDEMRATDRLELDLENVRAAVLWLTSHDEVEPAMEAVLALAEFGTRLAAPLGAVAAEVAAMPAAAEHPLRAVALASAAWHLHQRDGVTSDTWATAKAAVEAAGSEPSKARCRAVSALMGIGAVRGEMEAAVAGGNEMIAMAEELGDQWELLQGLTIMAGLASVTGEGPAVAERAVALAQEIASPSYIAYSRSGLGISVMADRPEEARDHLEAARRAAIEARNGYAESVAEGGLGAINQILGETVLAAQHLLAAVVAADAVGQRAHLDASARALASSLAIAGDEEGALLVDAWADHRHAPPAAMVPYSQSDDLAMLHARQSAEDRARVAARAAGLAPAELFDFVARRIEALDRSQPRAG